jgi:hypothetical protein
MACTGAASAWVAGWAACAWEATDCRIDPASRVSGVPAADGGIGDGKAGVGMLGEGPRYIESMVGRSAAPNGVERKSVGSSLG